MAGRGHHYIPQFLQRGFSARVTKAGKHQVLVFEKDRNPYLTGTINIFRSRDFYGTPDDTSVDDHFTDQEDHLASFLNEVRLYDSPTILGRSAPASRLFYQLCVRVRWLREFAGNAATYAIDLVSHRLSTTEGRVALLVEHYRKEPDFLTKELEKQFRARLSRSPSRLERRLLHAIAGMLIRSPELMAQFMGPSTLLPVAELKSFLPDALVGGHQSALKRTINEPTSNFRDYFDALQWVVLPVGKNSLILGDAGPLFYSGELLLAPAGGMAAKDRHGAILPVSSSHLLVGYSGENYPQLTASKINAASAGWASEAFIASTEAPEFIRLQASIGRMTSELMTEQLRGLEGSDQ